MPFTSFFTICLPSRAMPNNPTARCNKMLYPLLRASVCMYRYRQQMQIISLEVIIPNCSSFEQRRSEGICSNCFYHR